jgi:NodT family efflux transporter outer membrane factor (OMF) lipoprotein
MRKATSMKNNRVLLIALLLASILLLLLASCGHRYEAPAVSMPEKYLEERKFTVTEDEGNEADLRVWWEQFNDPLLTCFIDEALTANYDLLIAGTVVKQARANYQIQGAPLWPQLSATASETRERLSQTLSFSQFQGPALQNIYQFGFDASWELDFFGKIQSAKEAAYFQYEGAIENLRDIQVTMVAEVAMQYINIRTYQQRLKVVKDLERVRADLVHLNTVNFEAGLIDDIVVEESKSLLEQTRAQIPILETSLQQSIFSLAILLGRQPENIGQEFEEAAPIPIATGRVPLGLPSDLLKRRPDLRYAEQELFAAMANVNVAKADFFPTISLTAFFGYETTSSKLWTKWASRAWNIGPNLNWSIFTGGALVGNFRLQKALREQAKLTYEKTVITALGDVEDSLVAYANEEVRQDHLSKALAKDTTARDLNLVLFRAGLSDFSPVLQTDELVLSDEDALLQSNQSLMIDLISLYKALGGGWDYTPMEDPCCTTQ